MDNGFAVYGCFMEYGEVVKVPIEFFDTEEEADAACIIIEIENTFNTMYEWYEAGEY